MDIEQLQEYIELVTFANLDELTNIDPLFVKLFRLSQFTIEYLLHSQDYLKLLISKETEKIAKRDKRIKNSDSELAKLRNEIIQLKKENKKRRRIVEEQQRMMEVGANSFYKESFQIDALSAPPDWPIFSKLLLAQSATWSESI